MNYIKQLKEENERLKNELIATRDEIHSFISFLHSDKFTGVQSDGSRKDWISTGDAINKLREIRDLVV